MISGLTEFGFLLNEYMNILDGPREGARYAADKDPSKDGLAPAYKFYTDTAAVAIASIKPITVDPHMDDVVISAFKIGKNPSDPSKSQILERYPADLGGYYSFYHHFGSKFTNEQVEDLINNEGSGIPPNSGAVLVEIYYNYHQLLKLPWITLFVKDPILVSSYTFMPCDSLKP